MDAFGKRPDVSLVYKSEETKYSPEFTLHVPLTHSERETRPQDNAVGKTREQIYKKIASDIDSETELCGVAIRNAEVLDQSYGEEIERLLENNYSDTGVLFEDSEAEGIVYGDIEIDERALNENEMIREVDDENCRYEFLNNTR